MKKKIREQVNRILDENPQEDHDVIVQMDDSEDQLQSIIEAGTEAIQRRHLTMSARDLTPPPASIIKKTDTLSLKDKNLLKNNRESSASLVTLANINSVALAALKSSSLGTIMNALLGTPLVSKAIESASVLNKKIIDTSGMNHLPAGFRPFWSSKSALLRLNKDDLHRLPDLDGISSVTLNSKVKMPPIVEIKHIPQAIEDYKTSSWGIDKIGALSVWGAYHTRGISNITKKPITVAVLDTGIDDNHPELKGKVSEWAEFDREGNMIKDSSPHDSWEHGTHVCGIIAGGRPEAPSKENPIIGVAPDVQLAVGLVLNKGVGTYAQILAGLDWAIETGADVINMSLGGIAFEPDVNDLYTRSILYANQLGIPVVAAIGNEGAQTSGAPGSDYFSLAVGATDCTDQPGGFSGGRTQVIYNSRYIPQEHLPLVYSKPDLSAPGVGIRSCIPNDKYATWNGTSMAAPHVTGSIALLLAATDIHSIPPQRRAFLLQDILLSSVEEMGESGKDHRYGFGRINTLRAIALAKEKGY